MKKAYRVCKNEEFSKIIAKRRSKASPCFVLYYAKKELDHGRVGISVSKKLGNAVKRNKIKRQVREMIHDVVDLDQVKYDYIIIVRREFLNHNFQDNKKRLEKMIKVSKID